MHSIEFKKISLKNFMSFGPTTQTLELNNGLNLITGYNKDYPSSKNGIGKSTICDSLIFCLFGETIKELNMSEIVNDVSKKNCVVSLELAIHKNNTIQKIEITRGIGPSFCSISINGEDKTASSIPLTTKYIESLLGINKKLFQQSIILSIGNSLPFFKLNKADKRNFIEGIFNLDIFSKMLSDITKDFSKTKGEKDTVSLSISSEDNRFNQYKDKQAGYEDNKRAYISELLSENEKNEKNILELKTKIIPVPDSTELQEKLKIKQQEYNKLDETVVAVNVKCKTIEREVSDLSTEVKKLESLSDICIKCNRPLDQNEILQRKTEIEIKKQDIIDKKQLITNVTTKLDLLKQNKSIMASDVEELKSQLLSIKSVKDKNVLIEGNINTIKQTVENNLVKLKNKESETSAFDDLISASEKKLLELKASQQQIIIEYKTLESCKLLLSEEGVKSKIINELKNSLNSRINMYLRQIESPFTCTFDEYFGESIKNINGVEKSYDSMSGGEKRRMDLAILFTLQDILKVRSGIDIRLAFYDEILDTSIDETGRTLVLNILKEKSTDSSIYVISHRPKMSDMIDNEIVLEKTNGFTIINQENK